MPVTMVRNTQPGPTVISSDPKGTHFVEWAGSGDPSGGDIQPVPEEIVNTPQFEKAKRRGIFVLVEDGSDEATVALDKQVSAWNASNDTKNEVIKDSIEGAEARADVPIEQPLGDDKHEGVVYN
jgi:hypothetical protein